MAGREEQKRRAAAIERAKLEGYRDGLREAAEIADSYSLEKSNPKRFFDDPYCNGAEIAQEDIAEAIRAKLKGIFPYDPERIARFQTEAQK